MNLNQNWQFDVLNIYNYNQFGNLEHYFNFIKKNHKKIDGDLLEAGVFNGRSLLGTALLLKELGSKKKVYGYDSWEGFPKNSYSVYDDFNNWKRLLKKKSITKKHYNYVMQNLKFRSLILNKKIKKLNPQNISSSLNFSGANYQALKKKIKLLKLDNIVLIKGNFDNTMKRIFSKKIFSVLIDADLYKSYKTVFNFVWKKIEKNGIIYLDEYYSLKFPGAKIATDEICNDHNIKVNKFKQIKGDFERWYLKK